MNEKIRFIVFSLAILNLFYFLILVLGSGSFLMRSVTLFTILMLSAYFVHSFGVIRFGKFSISASFFFLFPMLVVFGPIITSMAAYVISLFQYTKIDLSRRIYSGVQYAVSYAAAGLAIQILGVNIYGLIVAFAIFKILNFILVDLFLYFYLNRYRNFRDALKYLLLETGIFALVIPTAYVLYLNLKDNLILYFSVYTLLFPFFLTYMLSIENKSRIELEKEKVRLSKHVNELKRVLEVSELLKSNVSLVDLMMRVASIIHDDLGWEYVLVSLVRSDDSIERIAYSGITEDDFKKLQANCPTLSFVKNIMRDEFKVSNSYFIPEEADISLPDEMVYVGKYDIIDGTSWRDKDLLWIPIYDKSGKMIAYISPDKPKSGKRPSIEDITILEIFADQVRVAIENSSEFETLQEKTIRDPQTGLYNHTEFYNRMDKLVQEKEKFSLLMMDIDDFKFVNDSYGHQTGDVIIEYLAERIKLSIRRGDIAARYGGDEFTIILRGTEKMIARTIAERLRLSVAEGNPPVKITISIGIAEYPSDSLTSNGIISVADKALYMAKMHGKNQVEISN
jgi:diguanylate cyclase (GGDEF)-like protein